VDDFLLKKVDNEGEKERFIITISVLRWYKYQRDWGVM
jgi:hypothetical protein